jgi:hypothetical protein
LPRSGESSMTGTEKTSEPVASRMPAIDNGKNAAANIAEFLRKSSYEADVCHSGVEGKTIFALHA